MKFIGLATLLIATLVLIFLTFMVGQVVGAQRVYSNRFAQEKAWLVNVLGNSYEYASIMQDSQGRAIIFADDVGEDDYRTMRNLLLERIGSRYVDFVMSGVHTLDPSSGEPGVTSDDTTKPPAE